MDRTVWIIIAIVALAVAGFFGYRSYQTSQQRDAERLQAESMEKELDATRLTAKEAVKNAERDAEARRLAELKAAQVAEAESRRLAQLQSESQAQEEARKRAEEQMAKTSQELDRIRADKARLEAETRRLEELRASEGKVAQDKLEQAQRALLETERQKNAEIERQAALIASYSQRAAAITPETRVTAAPVAEAVRERKVRFISPGDFKRAGHHNLQLLPVTD